MGAIPTYDIVCNFTEKAMHCLATPYVQDTIQVVTTADAPKEPSTAAVVVIAVLIVLGGFYALGLRKD